MARNVRCGLIQVRNKVNTEAPCEDHRNGMIEAHLPYIEEAASKGVQILCFQEIFTGSYFCPSQDSKWYGLAEAIPDGPTTRLMQGIHSQCFRMKILRTLNLKIEGAN